MSIRYITLSRIRKKMINRHSGKNHRYKGQGMLELALTLPIFLLLVYGIFEFARAIFIYSSVLNASRDAARYAAASDAVQAQGSSYLPYYMDCTGIRERAQRVSTVIPLTSITINYDSGPGTTIIADSCEKLNTDGTHLNLGDRVSVTVKAKFTSVVSILNLTDIPISSTTTRSIVTGMDIWSTPIP